MIRYKLNDEIRKEARDYQKKVMETNTMNHANYTNLESDGRYFVGYLGEWAFDRFLNENQIPHKWDCKADGYSDKADFIINNKLIDVKTSSDGGYKIMLISAAQVNKYQKDIYVSCGLRNGYIEIYGFCYHQTLVDMPTVKLKILSKKMPHEELLTIDELLPILRNRKV